MKYEGGRKWVLGRMAKEGFRGSNFKLQLQVALGEEETRKRDMDSENNG